MASKQCTKCRETFQLSFFSKDGQKRDGLASHCKQCRLTAARIRNGVTPDRHFANLKKYETKAELQRAWRQNNPEAYRASIAKRDPEVMRAAQKRWRDKNRERERARTAEWQRQNRDLVARNGAARRAAERRACPVWGDRAEMADWYRLAEVMSRGGVKFTVDHMVPIRSKTVCGLHVPANFQLLTGLENSSKSNRYWPDMP